MGELGGFILLFGVSIVALVFIFLAVAISSNAKQERRIQEITTAAGLSEAETLASHFGPQSISLDDSARKILLSDGIQSRVLDFENLLSVEVVESGETVTITRTNRGSQLAGALVGRVVFGGLGAVVGGLSGRTTSTTSGMGSIELRVATDDLHLPYVVIPVLGAETSKSSSFYKTMLSEAHRWNARLSAIIRECDRRFQQANAHQPLEVKHDHSIGFADELHKLAKLRSEGVLTQLEFDDAKKRLIRGPEQSAMANIQTILRPSDSTTPKLIIP